MSASRQERTQERLPLMRTRAQAVTPATAARSDYRFWMMASVAHLLLITFLLVATLIGPYLMDDPASSPGRAASFALVVLLIVPYIWVTALAIRTLTSMPGLGTRVVGGLPLRMLRRINTVGFVFDATLFVVAGMYVAGTPLPRIVLIAVISLLVVLAFALPPAVFIAKIHLTRIGQARSGRLDELRRLRTELRRQHDPTRRT